MTGESVGVPSSYDTKLITALGLLSLEFSRLERSVQRLLAGRITPHQFVGEMAVAGMAMQQMTNRARALVEARLEPGDLAVELENWLAAVEEVTQRRNGLVHGHWLTGALVHRVAVKKGRLNHNFTEETPENLAGLARKMWQLHGEGGHLEFDLARAGFGDVTVVDGEGVTRHQASREYRLVGGAPSPRPESAWPGEALLESCS
jgi:hypothetical protein